MWVLFMQINVERLTALCHFKTRFEKKFEFPLTTLCQQSKKFLVRFPYSGIMHVEFFSQIRHQTFQFLGTFNGGRTSIHE